jgi:hypothetical protein
MTYPVAFTASIIALMAISATLAYFVGLVLGKRRADDSEERAWRDGFDAGADLAGKTRRIQERAERLQR